MTCPPTRTFFLEFSDENRKSPNRGLIDVPKAGAIKTLDAADAVTLSSVSLVDKPKEEPIIEVDVSLDRCLYKQKKSVVLIHAVTTNVQ